MKKFMDENFLLQSETAVTLYHDYAKNMPIIDYHCHLNPKEICEDKRFTSITDVMLGGDHYKWRAMRSNGIPEEYITGGRDDYEKFLAYACTLKYAIGNPLYHWTHLELQRFFDIYDILNEKNARSIYDRANALLAGDDFSAQRLIERSNVQLICTTDDPASDLCYHKKIREEGKLSAKVLPAFRPDNAVEIGRETFCEYIKTLCEADGTQVTELDGLKALLVRRIDYFHEAGCRISDHGLSTSYYAPSTDAQADAIFKTVLSGGEISPCEEEMYKTNLLRFLACEYHKRGWVMQIHIGTLRNNNSRMFKKVGSDTGFDSINDTAIAERLSKFLNACDEDDALPKTILYVLNPKDNYVIGTMLGNFQSSDAPSKIQFGSGWWFCDQRDGMTEQMKALANLGLLGRFVGMLTDSRSFLSYPRHEYFRRIMCNLLGGWVDAGEYPCDFDALGGIVKGISYENAKDYFGIKL